MFVGFLFGNFYTKLRFFSPISKILFEREGKKVAKKVTKKDNKLFDHCNY